MAYQNFHASHAPFGAFASFTCGYASAASGEAELQGGFSPATRHPANQSQFFGWRHEDETWNLFPFLADRRDASEDFVGDMEDPEAVARSAEAVTILNESELGRELQAASDRFSSGPFTLTFYTPFERIPDWESLDSESQKRNCAPLVVAELVLDNTSGTSALEGIFGIVDDRVGLRSIGDTHPELTGFASGRTYGFAAKPSLALSLRSGMNLFSRFREDERGLHLLGSEAALVARAEPGQRLSIPIVLGFYQQGLVTTGIDAGFYYTRYFDSLESVLTYGLENADTRIQTANTIDQKFAAFDLAENQSWLLSHSIHSYLASTELLQMDNGKALWAVNEGEYRMLNTFDLTIDHLFFELEWWPWSVRDTLDLFLERYSYRDSIHSPDGEQAAGGIAFTHDMGADDQFSRPGYSFYELPNLNGCFSYMSAEQLLNWVCASVTYSSYNDDWGWLKERAKTLEDCAESMRRRDHPDPDKRNGIIGWDSDRCGPKGSEITTYDSLDVSLGQARNNLYLAVKALGAWHLMEHAFAKLGLEKQASDARREATRLAATLASLAGEDGYFPAVFEAGNKSRIIPAVEGLAFLIFLGLEDSIHRIESEHGFLTKLRRHVEQSLQSGTCLTKDGGWKLSSTSDNTWMSKIFLSQYVVKKLWPELVDEAADAAHQAWQLSETTRKYTFCDQIRCTDGFPLGSRNYPRGVTAWLWTR